MTMRDGTPDYLKLAGETITPPDNNGEKIENITFADSPEYGDDGTGILNPPPEQGGESSTVNDTFDLADHYRKASKMESRKASWQVPDSFDTRNGIVVPDNQTGTPIPVQLYGRSPTRKRIVLSNTGAHAITIGLNPNKAQNDGFTMAASGDNSTCLMEFDTQAPIWAWCAGGQSSTVDIFVELREV